HRQVGGKAAAEQQRARHLQPFGQLTLELLVQGMVATDQVRGGGAGALAGGGVLQRGGDLELARQAEVVIAAEASQPLPVHLQAHAIAAADGAALAYAPLRGTQAVAVADAFVAIDAGHGSCPSPPGALRAAASLLQAGSGSMV